MCVLDVAKFHRTCPLRPEHKPYLVVCDHLDDFYVDHCFCFGASPASSNSGMISAAFVDIWCAKGVALIAKLEDDCNVFCIPNSDGSFNYDKQSMIDLIAFLGVPWHPNKGNEFFVFITKFIGFLWDIENKRVSLPEDKHIKYLHQLDIFITNFKRRPAPLTLIESIHGILCHLAFLHPDGRSHLPPISNFMTKYHGNRNDSYVLHPPNSMISELIWWHAKLMDPHHYRQLRLRAPLHDYKIYVDASTDWGIGILIGGCWAAFKLKEDWKIPGRDICWLETVAIELLVYYLESMDFHDAYLLLHSDNTGTIGAHDKGRSANYWINMSVRRTWAVLGALHIETKINYIESAENPADPISRGDLGLLEDKLPLPFLLPLELEDVLFYV